MIRQIGRELRAQSSGNTDIDPDQLLSFIEAAGMLPPPSKPMDFTKLGGTNVFNWEPEDEQEAV